MDVTQLIVETATQQIRVALREPMTMAELWSHFIIGYWRPNTIIMTHGIARVIMSDRRKAAQGDGPCTA